MRVPALASAAMMLLGCAAHADGTPPTSTIKPGPTGWQFQFTPYAWLPWVEGDAVVQGTLVRGQREPRAGARIPRLCLDELHAGAAGRGDAVLRHHLCRRHQRRFIGAVEDVLSARRGHAGCSAVFRLQLLDRRNGRHVRDQPLELRQQLRRRDRYLARDPRWRPLLAPGAGRQRGAGRHAECRRPDRLRHHARWRARAASTGSIRSWACGCTTSRRWRTN